MLNHLQNEFNNTQTANGAFAYGSTKSDVLDLFALGGAFRSRTDQEVAQLFSSAYSENPLLAMKTLFYLRDVTQGQGERRFFRLSLKHLATHSKESLKKNLHLIPQFGRWDDLWVLLETGLKDDVVKIVSAQFAKDLISENPSLLGKWMSSENASSLRTKKYASILRKGLGLSQKDYRKSLTYLRKKISIVETKLTEKNYEEIDYSKLPSKAGMIYRDAFYRNDGERYASFLDSLSKGEVTVNAGTLYPNDIVGKILGNNIWGGMPRLSPQEIQLFEGQWQNLTNFIGDKKEDSLVMADVSESMNGTPMNVSIALAMYIAERNKGIYKDHFMTFTDEPSLVQIKGVNIVDKVYNIRARKGYSTNIAKALQVILDTATKNNLSNEDIVKKLYIISDMQFDDYSIDGTSVHIFEAMKKKFNENGYDFPSIVFWNVNAFMTNVPFKMDETGVMLVSGYSPSILKNLLGKDNLNPYDLMLEVITSDRYKEVTV